MAAPYEFSDQVLWLVYLGIALVIPSIVMLFDDGKVHNRG